MERRWLAGGAVGAIGLLLAAIQIAHAIQQTAVPVAVAVDAVPFAAMGIAVAAAGAWLARTESVRDGGARVALWCVGGMVALASVSALVLFSQRVTTGTLARAAYLTMDLVTVGALAGVLVGVYDARSRARRAEVAAERDRIEAFAGKAADVNNYGRAIYGARSADGVAAYVVEAVEALVGLPETAVVRVAGEDVDRLADTTRAVDAATLGDLARAATAYDTRDVVVHEEPWPVDLPPAVAALVTALVDDRADGAVVVIALSTEEGAVREPDRQLLELVVSHAAATLRRLADDRAERPA